MSFLARRTTRARHFWIGLKDANGPGTARRFAARPASPKYAKCLASILVRSSFAVRGSCAVSGRHFAEGAMVSCRVGSGEGRRNGRNRVSRGLLRVSQTRVSAAKPEKAGEICRKIILVGRRRSETLPESRA